MWSWTRPAPLRRIVLWSALAAAGRAGHPVLAVLTVVTVLAAGSGCRERPAEPAGTDRAAVDRAVTARDEVSAPPTHAPPTHAARFGGVVYAYVWHHLEAPPVVPAGVDHLLVRAGEIGAVEGAGIACLLPQALEHLPGDVPVTLVYRVRQALNDVFENEPGRIRAALHQAIEQDRATLADRGLAWHGVQIDFDCPTRLLAAYATFLTDLDTEAPAETPSDLSITTLPTWLDATAFDDVAGACDWLVAQTYALTLPDRVEDPPRIASAQTIRSWARGYDALAARTGVPYVVGLPTYGHDLVFDETGRRRTIAADLAPTDAYAASDLRPAAPAVRDGLHVQHRFETADGWTVRITAIGAEGLAAALRLATELDPARRRGIALFRLARAEADLALPAASVEAVLSGADLGPRLDAAVERRDGTWRLVITNRGAGAHLPGTEPAAMLRVQPPGRAFVHLPLGEPYVVERRLGPEKVGPNDVCDRVAFWLPFLGPQRTVTVPVIRVGDAALVRVMGGGRE